MNNFQEPLDNISFLLIGPSHVWQIFQPRNNTRELCCGSEIIFSDPDRTFQEISDPDPILDPT